MYVANAGLKLNSELNTAALQLTERILDYGSVKLLSGRTGLWGNHALPPIEPVAPTEEMAKNR